MSDPNHDTASAEILPRWDLSKDFYAGPNDPKIREDLAASITQAEQFATKYKGKLATLSGDELASVIVEYETLMEKAARPEVYAMLLLSTDTQDKDAQRLNQLCSEENAKAQDLLTFWALELCAIDKAALEQKHLDSQALERWRPFLSDIRRYTDHLLSEKEESLLTRISPTGLEVWLQFLAEEKSRLEFHVNGKTLNETELSNLVDDPLEATRQAALAEKVRVFATNSPIMRYATKLMNTLIANSATEDELRGYSHPISSRNLSNNIEDHVVDAMIDTVKANYHRTSHRYNKLKGEIFGKKQLEAHNEFAPAHSSATTIIPWEEAKQMVLDAYRQFSPVMTDYAEKMFNEGYIDASVHPGKESGAYAMPPQGTDHPFLFMNYQGKADDVVTLAHELGHNIHQWLAYEAQGILMAQTPETLSETASTFGEELVFEELLKRIQNPTERKSLLMRKIENELSSIERQVQYVDFEREIHERRKKGELDTEEFSSLWLEKMKERAGPDFVPMAGQENGWASIPHIFSTPFYVYSYAFGESLVEAMFAAWREGKIENFEEKYLDMLKAGGTKHHKDLLAPMGLDASQPDFWLKGIEVRSHHIDELEKLVVQEKLALKTLDDCSVKTTPSKGYSIEVTRQENETSQVYDTRSQVIAATLKQALGGDIVANRGLIQVSQADGVVAEKLAEMASAKLEIAR